MYHSMVVAAAAWMKPQPYMLRLMQLFTLAELAYQKIEDCLSTMFLKKST